MAAKCPGNSRMLRIKTTLCPFCNTELEFFSDEGYRTCFTCRKIVFVDTLTACSSRCDIVNECLEINKWIEGGHICLNKVD